MSFHSWLTSFVISFMRKKHIYRFLLHLHVLRFDTCMHANTNTWWSVLHKCNFACHASLRCVKCVCVWVLSFVHTLPSRTKQWVTGLTWRSHLLPFHLTACVMRHLFSSYTVILSFVFEVSPKSVPKAASFGKRLDKNQHQPNWSIHERLKLSNMNHVMNHESKKNIPKCCLSFKSSLV